MQIGGRTADRIGSWIPITIGFLGQSLALGFFAFLDPETNPVYLITAIAYNGLASGLTLAPLHRAALSHVPPEKSSSAAGLYSMIRFSGSIFGPPIVALLIGLNLQLRSMNVHAYSMAFWFVCVITLIGFALSGALRVFVYRRKWEHKTKLNEGNTHYL
jgi:MFS family permease